MKVLRQDGFGFIDCEDCNILVEENGNALDIAAYHKVSGYRFWLGQYSNKEVVASIMKAMVKVHTVENMSKSYDKKISSVNHGFISVCLSSERNNIMIGCDVFVMPRWDVLRWRHEDWRWYYKDRSY